ncbi:hypothetical protein EYF80_027878 [Liparis tanakae]|uniref:Uncharacterized protein n=1 Tax=Liparis tanakae TaxID=230148 RepID=A0A4Z2HAP6_9TELE|nr:hypothetical protein EYF80_027878 [Liparis tanakae]
MLVLLVEWRRRRAASAFQLILLEGNTEVSGSRWEVMELRGRVGGDTTSCQALMQANIWRLLATPLLACRRGSSSPGPRATLRDTHPGLNPGLRDGKRQQR